MRYLLCLLTAFIFHTSIIAQLQHPDEFLPHKLGEHFTPHHMIVDYFEHVAANSPLVKLVQYGTTNEGRPLLVAIVTSEENHQKLEDIRLNNLRLTGMIEGEVNRDLSKALVWLSFSVHGNESAGTESSRIVLHKLADPENATTKEWLKNTVVFVDPSVNPDGFSRYTHWIRSTAGASNNPDINDIEHNEPWPGGRMNHYYFDLNRDWAWQTQKESQQRMKLYNQWLPHVHADLHEMGHESPYYFAPAARPYHKFITQWQQDFQVTIGKNHAKYFDGRDWLYFTKEVFDLFYPSYGDTYPTFSGAIGMTYEQGGSGVAGRGVELSNGEILTLKDRIDHHRTTALSTVEIGSIHKDALIDQFEQFYKKSAKNPVGKYKAYVIKKDKTGQRLKALATMLDNQGITYGSVSTSSTGRGLSYESGMNESFAIAKGDMIISAYQPKSILTQVLFDPESELEDSLTYDITAWSLPYAYGLEAYASTSKLTYDQDLQWQKSSDSRVSEAYAYLIPWHDMSAAQMVAHLSKNNISYRVSPEALTFGDQSYDAGTIIVTAADNRSQKDHLINVLNEGIKITSAQVDEITTGFASQGYDLGSRNNYLGTNANVLTIRGEGVSPYSFGQIKWYFNEVINHPLTVVEVDRLSRVNLDNYNTIILPDGWYSLSAQSKLSDWVNAGGKLIAIGNANSKLVDSDHFALKKYATGEEKSKAEKSNQQAEMAARYNHYSDRERLYIKNYIPGAIFKLKVDHSHPLGFGLGKQYFSLRTSSNRYPLMVDGYNIITHPKDQSMILGFAGSNVKSNLKDSMAFGVEEKGRGSVIYMVDNPLYRGFWYNGLFLFSNALFLVE